MNIGDPIPVLELPPITKEQLVRYAGASGDFNPIHWDADFARQSGYPGPIAHGMLSMAFLGRALTSWLGEPTAVLRLSARFKGVTYPGDQLTITGSVTATGTIANLMKAHLLSNLVKSGLSISFHAL